MAPRPPNHPPRGIDNPPASSEILEIQEIIDRAVSGGNFHFEPPKKPIINVLHHTTNNKLLQNRQNNNNNPPVTVTVIANNPTTTIVTTAPPATSSPVDDSDVSVDSSSTLNGGAIAGIVIGSIVGLLLLIWIFRSCSNLGAPPTDTPPRDGRAWYDGVRSDYPPPDSPRSPYRSTHRRHGHHHHHGHGHGGSRSRSHHSRHHYRRSGSIGVHAPEVQEVPVAVVRSGSRRRSTGRSPYRVYEDVDYDGRGRSLSRSRSRGRRYD